MCVCARVLSGRSWWEVRVESEAGSFLRQVCSSGHSNSVRVCDSQCGDVQGAAQPTVGMLIRLIQRRPEDG